MGAKLRVGLLLDSVTVPSWVFAAVKRLVRSNAAELVLVVLNQSQPVASSLGRRVLHDPRHGLYHIFNAIDQRLFLRGSNALLPVDATELLSGVHQLVVKPAADHGGQRFHAVDVDLIRSCQPDILVKLGFGNLMGDVLSAATYGIWAYRWGDSSRIEDGLTGFWEVANGWSETGAALQQLGSNSEGNLSLCQSWFFTYPYSPARNQNYVLWAAASFLSRQVEHLYRSGPEEYFRERSVIADRRLGERQSNTIPSNPAVLSIMLKLAVKNLGEAYRRKFDPKRWELLYSFEPEAEKKLASFRKITPPKDRFWADPHIVYQRPNYYIFIEEYLYQTQRGHIALMEMDRRGNYKQPVPILQENYHLSFPYVFNWLGQYYMIPESSENKTIDLYECTEFPHRWQHKLTLMKDIKAVDTTVMYVQGKWWLFTAIAEQQAAAPQVELFLFYANDLFTDQWNPHPRNPIVSDIKKARGAGGIFTKDGKLFRPSQYGSSVYGYGFDVNEIVTLSETEYCERTVTMVRPKDSRSIIATHTYANRGNLTVIDALTRRPKWTRTA